MTVNLDQPDATPQIEDSYYILCEDLFKIYKQEDLEVVALRGLDLKVRRGEMMAIVGASGSGKTTLLNILSGLDTPSAGRASVGGRNLLTMTSADLVTYRRKEVGFVWQQTARNLVPYLSSLQNVELPMILEGIDAGPARTRGRELLEIVGLGHRLEMKPDRLSGGEQQRVAIAVSLANDPPLLLADEPTGELDSQTASEIFSVLYTLNQELGVTVVIVTHDPAIANQIDRVVAIRDGRISTESFRRVAFEGREAYVYHDEYAVVDRTGRLQIPKEYLERLDLKERARIRLEGDHVEVLPEDAAPEEEEA
ncbi:MAG: ATP-binding cassette domain-containing protein [Dehalococcoidia bacterium]|nr:ATP-binding cassette domain-containing protein [Dehalococcoidia bacterium]